MTEHAYSYEHHAVEPVERAEDRWPGEVVSLADRRYQDVVAAAREFLKQARGFGWSPPPYPAPGEIGSEAKSTKTTTGRASE